MPNIEMVGFFGAGEDNNALDNGNALVRFAEAMDTFAKSANDISKKIHDALADTSYASDVVVTSILSATEDRQEVNQAFLRIWATSASEVEDIVKRLDSLDIDIEVAPLLLKFIPKRSIRDKDNAQPSLPLDSVS